MDDSGGKFYSKKIPSSAWEIPVDDFDANDDINLKTRLVTSVKFLKSVSHWYLECETSRSRQKLDEGKPDDNKIIKIDSVKQYYRVVYNAKSVSADTTLEEFKIENNQPTVKFVVAIVAEIGREKGKWTKEFNCEAFAFEFLRRLRQYHKTV
jgi:hypothetical protein